MARPKGSRKSVPSYCHHRASGQAYVTIGGVERYLGKYDSPESRAAYDRAVAEWLTGGRVVADVLASAPAPTLTVATVLAAFWEHAKAEYPDPEFVVGKRPDGELGNYYDCIKIIRRLYGTLPVADFRPRTLKALRVEMIRLEHCRNYINRNVSRIKAIFRWGVEAEMVKPDVHAALVAVKGLKYGKGEARESEPVKPVPDDVLEATLPFLSRHVRAMVDVQLLTGARPGEVCALRTCDIDMREDVWTYRPEHHKTLHHGHAREISIGPRAQAVLQPFLKTDLSACVFSPADAEAERRAKLHEQRETPLSCGNTPGSNRTRKPRRQPGNQYDVDSYRRAIARAADRANSWSKGGRIVASDERVIPRWHPHQIRHTAGTRLRREHGVDAANIILGHTTLRATQIYAEMDMAKARKIMAEVG